MTNEIMNPGDTAIIEIKKSVVFEGRTCPKGTYWLTRHLSSNFSVDLDENIMYIQEEKIKLNPTDAVVASVLCEVYPRIASYDFLLDRTDGGYSDPRTIQAIRSSILRIRKATEHTKLRIEMERGTGYKFIIR